MQREHHGFLFFLGGIVVFMVLLFVIFAVRGSVVGKAITTNMPCKDGVMLTSCATDSTGNYLITMSCEHGRWREITTKCNCQLNQNGAYCA